jgi:thiol-disulfide isomerase/thioredoxin
MKRVLLFAMLALAVTVAGCSKDKDKQPATAAKSAAAEGAQAPDFSVNDLNGKSVTLSQLRGKVVLVNFWATWCPPCREEIPSMVKLNQFMAGKPYQMLALSIDEGGKQAIEEFFKSSGHTLPAYLDGEQKVGRVYGITGVPETFILDKNGIIVKKVVGGMDWNSPEVISYLEGLMKK